MGNAGFISSTVVPRLVTVKLKPPGLGTRTTAVGASENGASNIWRLGTKGLGFRVLELGVITSSILWGLAIGEYTAKTPF